MTKETTALVTKEQLEQEILPVVQQANAITITTSDGYAGAVDFLKNIKAAQAKVTGFFGPIKKAAREAWKKVCDGETQFLKPLQNAEATVKIKAVRYMQAEEEKRLAAQRKLQAEADEKARREREVLEKKAAKLKTPEKAAAKLEQAATVIAPVIEVQSTFQKQEGAASLKTTWKAELVDMEALTKEAAGGNALAKSFLEFNQKAADAFARSTKGQIACPGVKWNKETSLAVSTK